jgi:8-oxo-dGTP diphosphatase
VVSVAYLALAPDLPVPVAGTDAAAASWVPVSEVSTLAFDHARILSDGVERARAKLEYTPLGTEFCGAEFTVAELRRVYEIVWGISLDPRNFHRKVTGVDGLLEATGETTTRDGGRPAALFRRGPATALHPPLVRG